MTRHAGSGVRPRRRPSRKGFASVTVTFAQPARRSACGLTRRRGTPLARSWLLRRREAKRQAAGEGERRAVGRPAGWAQMLARGMPRRLRYAAHRCVAHAVSLLECMPTELITELVRNFHIVRVVLS